MHSPISGVCGDASRAASVLPFDPGHVLLVYRGRAAVWWAAKLLGLGEGDEVLVPAYHCGSEVDPLVRFGLSVRTYDVGLDLSAGIQSVAVAATKRTRAVYVIHHFGIARPLRALARWCHERSLLLIEDCALALFAQSEDGSVGSAGDASIYSFRKTLPVPDGGALVLRDAQKIKDVSLAQPPARRVCFELGKLFGRWVRSQMPTSLDSWIGRPTAHDGDTPAGSRGERLPLAEDDRFDTATAEWAMSRVSRRISAAADPMAVKSRRRENFQFLLETLGTTSGVRPVIADLPDGACPVVFPVECDRRNALYRYLIERKIAAIPWWAGFHEAIEWDACPVAQRLKQSVVALPVHQGLGHRHMAYIAECIRDFAETRAVAPAESDAVADNG